jgi:hypothetical protein
MIYRWIVKEISAETPRVNWNSCLSLTNTYIHVYVCMCIICLFI